MNARIIAGNTEVDFYQVRWTINRNGVVQTYPQQRIYPDGYLHATAPFGPIAAADRSFVIGYANPTAHRA